MTSAIPPYAPRDDEPSARGFGDASDASQTKMPRTLFLRRKSVGKGRVGEWRFLYTGYCAR